MLPHIRRKIFFFCLRTTQPCVQKILLRLFARFQLSSQKKISFDK